MNEQTNHQHADEIRQKVRDAYAEVAEADSNGSCCGEASSCCGVSDDAQINTIISSRLGYSQEDQNIVPDGADMGLGCGNPRAIASLNDQEKLFSTWAAEAASMPFLQHRKSEQKGMSLALI